MPKYKNLNKLAIIYESYYLKLTSYIIFNPAQSNPVFIFYNHKLSSAVELVFIIGLDGYTVTGISKKPSTAVLWGGLINVLYYVFFVKRWRSTIPNKRKNIKFFKESARIGHPLAS